MAVETELTLPGGPREGGAPAAPPSASGPADTDAQVRMPPARSLPKLLQTIGFARRPLTGPLDARRALGDVWQLRLLVSDDPFVVTSHPDHVEALFRANPQDAPSMTGESPLRPILGPNSVLTSVGDRHLRQRRLLLPSFHGEAIARYVALIEDLIERELDSWPTGRPLALAPRMRAVTLDVIMAGVFGIEGTPPPGSPEERMGAAVRRIGRLSTHPLWQMVELAQFGRLEPHGPLRAILTRIDRQLYAAIRARRAAPTRPGATDVLSLLLATRDEHGQPLTDRELRDELLTLVLAGHETTANSLAWTFERLVRNPAPYDRLRELVRSDHADADAYVDATIYEAMRVRPVIPMVVRRVRRPWRLGEYVVPAGTPVAVSIVALHHREDVYPDPHGFRPERFLANGPGTYTWIPFGGGTRRCLGATLALAEQRVVLRAIARRTDLDGPRQEPEAARQRNVTMIPRHGGRVVVRVKRVR